MKESENKAVRETGDPARGSLPEFRRVLAATDLSERSNRAIVYAYALLRAGGVVRIVHVEQPFEFANPIHGHHSTATARLETARLRQLEECRAQLRALIPAEAEASGIRTDVEVLHQDRPGNAICQAAENWGADVICLASHGRSGFAKTLLGSVAHAVLNQSPIPVLVIRSPA